MYWSEALTSVCVCVSVCFVVWYVLCVCVSPIWTYIWNSCVRISVNLHALSIFANVCAVHARICICWCCNARYMLSGWICALCVCVYLSVCGSFSPLAQIFSQLSYRCQLLLFIFSSRGFVERLVVRRVAGQLLGFCSVSAVTGSQAVRRRLVITSNWNCFVCAQLVSCYSLSAVIAADTRLWFV